jgi:hypothetical protein
MIRGVTGNWCERNRVDYGCADILYEDWLVAGCLSAVGGVKANSRRVFKQTKAWDIGFGGIRVGVS